MFRGLFKELPLWDSQAARHGGRTMLGPRVLLGAPHCKHGCLPGGTGPVALNLQKPLLAPWAPSFLLRGGPTPLSSWGAQAMEQRHVVMKPLYVGSRGLAVPEQEQLLPRAQVSYPLVQLCVCKLLGAPPRRIDSTDDVRFPQRWGGLQATPGHPPERLHSHKPGTLQEGTRGSDP